MFFLLDTDMEATSVWDVCQTFQQPFVANINAKSIVRILIGLALNAHLRDGRFIAGFSLERCDHSD